MRSGSYQQQGAFRLLINHLRPLFHPSSGHRGPISAKDPYPFVTLRSFQVLLNLPLFTSLLQIIHRLRENVPAIVPPLLSLHAQWHIMATSFQGHLRCPRYLIPHQPQLVWTPLTKEVPPPCLVRYFRGPHPWSQNHTSVSKPPRRGTFSPAQGFLYILLNQYQQHHTFNLPPSRE